MTERLYEADSHCFTFTATVTACEKSETGYAVELDRTAFFPEGGGQAGDSGYLDAVHVRTTHFAGERILHETETALAVGQTVEGRLDAERRLAFMQNHSGEHIVSGWVHRLYGLENVGFHLGETFVTMDFSGLMTAEQLAEVETLANRSVWENRTVRCYYPSAAELAVTEYRSKKAIDGPLRLVVIDGVDCCACCAPHVKATGEIGLIKLLATEKMRGGTRVVLKSGAFALADYRQLFENNSRISALLSAKPEETAQAVSLLCEAGEKQKAEWEKQKQRYCQWLVQSAKTPFVFTEGLSPRELQQLADGLATRFSEVAGAFSATATGVVFALCGAEEKLEPVFDAFRSRFAVRGGGRSGIRQGTVAAETEEMKKHFSF